MIDLTKMKTRVNSLQSLMAALLSAAILSSLPLKAAPAANYSTKSVFIIPKNPQEGHDPFFPDSTRPYESSNPHVVVLPSIPNALAIEGISHDSHNRYFAIIGNHSYAVGDEGDVSSIHFRVVEIRDNAVVVEVDGQRHELPFSDSP